MASMSTRTQNTNNMLRSAEGTMNAVSQMPPGSITRTNNALRSAEGTMNAVAQMPTAPVVEDSGGWAYRMLDDGRIEIVSAPATSKKLKAGHILDPKQIDAIQDPAQRQRAGTAYASILSKVKTGQSIPEMQAKLSGGKKTPAGGATPAPAASAAPSDTLRMQKTPEDAPGPGISAVSPPPAAEVPKPGSSPGRLPNTKSFLNNFR